MRWKFIQPNGLMNKQSEGKITMMTVSGNWNTYRINKTQLKRNIECSVKKDLYDKIGWNKEY